MNRRRPTFDFLAVLVYEDGDGMRSEEPRVYSTTHPEIAYQLALADGKQERYGRRFLGLAYLDETTEEVPPIARSEEGDASQLVVDKKQLTAFCDARWKDVPWDTTELANALREPPPILEIEGLTTIRWDEYTHAYGQATEVAKDIRGLVSTDRGVREASLWQLFGSIYHQGAIYTATAQAVPFLLQITSDERIPERENVGELLLQIVDSSATHPEIVRKQWKSRRDEFGGIYANDWEKHAEYEIESITSVRRAFEDNMHIVRQLCSDSCEDVCRIGKAILKNLETPLTPTIPCLYCHGSGDCYCKRKGTVNLRECERCKGTARCHVCNGTGIRKE